ncbi:hypothetical protein GGS20DRAFT_473649 [Poronia punctata]|nr:hypothetical protein GGS20DRAFT_473649 [Poronia punctata]
MQQFLILFILCVSFIRHGRALQVTPGSSCAALCLDNPESDPLDPDSSNTKAHEITCTNDSYEKSSTGIKFKNCLDCLQNSNATSHDENDASWFLYNIRYSVDVCLFGFPEASEEISSPCNINWACQPLKNALEAGNLDATRDQFEYCSADGSFTDSRHIDDCIKCFASSPNQGYMSNFVTALRAGCEQKPAPGALIGLSGSLFTDEQVTITDPPADLNSDSDQNDSGLGINSTGAIVGIVVGGALLFLGGLALFWVYHRRQKRLFQGLTSPSDSNGSRGGSNYTTPPMARGYPYAEKRGPFQMREYELRTQRSYGMSDKETQPNFSNFIPRPGHHPTYGHTNNALPTHPAYLPQTHSRQGSREQPLGLPIPIKTNKPDDYAIQAYLNAAEDSGFLPPPPPGPPPAAAIGDASRYRGPSPSRQPSHSRDSSMGSRGPSPDRRPLLNSNQPPPPPVTRASKVPALSFPSVSRIRIPKKYTPPTIQIQGATPVEGPSETNAGPQSQYQTNDATGLGINTVSNEARFEETKWQSRRQQPPPRLPLAIATTMGDRPQPQPRY